jgi:Tat-targeted selenate reductase subunit YnfE/Tat-targeted selenate reductase subunit YnfF
VVDGEIVWVEGFTTADKTFEEDVEPRACLRGRSIRRDVNSPDRLKYPMKRVGPRGSGEFEQITWEEAIDIIAENYQRILDTYGGGETFFSGRPSELDRLMNLTGGRIRTYYADSYGAVGIIQEYLTGQDPLIGGPCGSDSNVMQDSDLIVTFGHTAAESMSGGAGGIYDFAMAREKGAKIVAIDPRMSASMSGHPEEWLPIRPGTDGALASALAYVLITEGLAAEDFLHSHTVGYDETTMPEGAPPNSSYQDYLLGTGYDMVAKTPEWAAPITLIPAERIYELARDIGNAKAAFIMQNWGIQRRTNGELAAGSIYALTVVSGHYGLPGTTTGAKIPVQSGGYVNGPYFSVPTGTNPIKAAIPYSARVKVVEQGEKMTILKDGLKYADLSKSPKFLGLISTGMGGTSAPDANWGHKVLSDESLAEFTLGCDIFMSSTMQYADVILPDTYFLEEELNLQPSWNGGSYYGYIFGSKVQEPRFECRQQYEWVAELADKLGLKEEYTEGKTWREWMEQSYEDTITNGVSIPLANYEATEGGDPVYDDAPTYPKTLQEALDRGFLIKPVEKGRISREAWRQDPEANPMQTPSGKFELYSTQLAELKENIVLEDPRDLVSPVPVYHVEVGGYTELSGEYPLQFLNWKSFARSHSNMQTVEVLKQAVRHQMWINPLDVEPRGIKNGDTLQAKSAYGTVQAEARVTPRIIPGSIGMEHGKWRDMDANGVDHGCSANTLVGHHFTSIGKFTAGAGSVNVQVVKA